MILLLRVMCCGLSMVATVYHLEHQVFIGKTPPFPGDQLKIPFNFFRIWPVNG